MVPALGETSSAVPSKVPGAKLGSCLSKEAPEGFVFSLPAWTRSLGEGAKGCF